MKKLIFMLLPLALLAGLSLIFAPMAATQIPPEANTNAVGIGISVPAGTYYVGDTIEYTVYVYVPAPSPPIYPAQQTNIDTYLTTPDGTTVFLGQIPVLNPGESYTFPAESCDR